MATPQHTIAPSDEAAWLDREIAALEASALADAMMTPDEREDLEDWEQGLDLEDLAGPYMALGVL